MVSILIPVYNAAHFLDRCISSLLAQSFHDWQAIMVDDGSTDESLAMLERAATDDGRIEVVHLPQNSGLSHARNVALEHVRGDLVCMLDADDWLSTDALSEAVAVFQNHPATDVVLFRFVYVDDQTGEERPFEQASFTVLSGKEAMRRTLLGWDGIHGVYMVRMDIHQRYPFDETTRVYSDENAARLHYLSAREVRPCCGTYYYRQHPSSLTHQGIEGYFDRMKANERLMQAMKEAGVDGDDLSKLYERCWLGIVDAYYYYTLHRNALTSDERREVVDKIRGAWSTIDVCYIPRSCRTKFGYRPLRTSWTLFRLQEEIYFRLRK